MNEQHKAVQYKTPTKKHLTHQLEEALAKITHMETYDLLTDLPNLSLFSEWVTTRLLLPTSALSAILIIDLDNFGDMNYRVGRQQGDILLQQIAKRIRHHLDTNDIIARKGSDQFIIFILDARSSQHVDELAQTLLQALALPYEINHNNIYLTASIGASLYPDDGENAELLFIYADMALQQAKKLGKNNYQLFKQNMMRHTQRTTKIETQLQQALLHDEFTLCYQSQIDTQTHTIFGMEALLRWNNAELGQISPLEFIPLAEKTGLIFPISDWVLREACQQMVHWTHALKPMQIAINLSAREFQSTNHGHSLVTRIESILEETKLSPMQLVLEITESSFIKNYATTIPILNALRALGVQIACDDFGTGYSSLTYLKRLPIDILKIDKLFIDELAWNSNDVVIIRAILAIAKQLGIQVIAEGVESRLQVAILQDLGCTMIQGFYFSRPTNAEEVTRLLYDKKN